MYNQTFWKAIDLITHDNTDTFKRRGSQADILSRKVVQNFEKELGQRKGVHFVTRKKEDLSTKNGVKGYITTSKETLISNAANLTHWTPNQFRFGSYTDDERTLICGHRENNLQQVNTFVVDIDTQVNVDVPGILAASATYSIGTPTLILKTTKGFQVYFVLSEPAYISNKNQFKSLKVAKRISENIKKSLFKHIPGIDIGCNDFAFFRIPRPDNILYFNQEQTYDFLDLKQWSMTYTKNNNELTVIEAGKKGKKDIKYDPTQAKWFNQLINKTNLEGGKGQKGRNHATFGLALALYAAGKTESEACDILDEFNSNLIKPLLDSEVKKCITSAFSGRYKGPKKSRIDLLFSNQEMDDEMKHSNAFKFKSTGYRVFKKHRKARKDRQYSHDYEWEMDVIQFIENKIMSGQTFLDGMNQKDLADEIGVPIASFKRLLQKSTKIVKKVEGQGRNAVTLLSTQAIILKSAIKAALQTKEKQSKDYANFIASHSPVVQKVVTIITQNNDELQGDISLFQQSNIRGSTERTVQINAKNGQNDWYRSKFVHFESS